MLTDWLIVRRVAAELDRTLRGKRIRAAGRRLGGGFGLRAGGSLVAIDAFGPTPIVTLEPDADVIADAGWVRAFADALAGLRIDAVRSRRGDRLIAFDASAQSRFGVRSGFRLVAELVPRFGNVVLLRDDTVVAAAKEFSGEGGARTTRTGDAYELPPLPSFARAESLGAALAALARDDVPARREAAGRALRAEVALVPKLVADSLVAEAAPLAQGGADLLAARCIARANAIVDAATGAPDALGDIYVYRDGTRLVAAHVVPLAQYAALPMSREPALLPLLAQSVGAQTRERARTSFEARRASLNARLQKRRVALRAQRASLEAERDDAAARDRLRRAGELIYAHLADVPPGASQFAPLSEPAFSIELDPELDAKANAAAIFRRYRKATARLAHAERRLSDLAAQERFGEELAWELERAEPETLDDVADSLLRLERRKSAAQREGKRRQKPLGVRVADDARIYVGRSPRGNADLTFRIARPDDLWFHARATPGAHVVLQLGTGRSATDAELHRAAGLAAYHSKAGAAEKVSVDYTERKHVRRQQNAPPGLVWYTNARTLLVAPAGETS